MAVLAADIGALRVTPLELLERERLEVYAVCTRCTGGLLATHDMTCVGQGKRTVCAYGVQCVRGVRKCLLPRTPRAACHRLECRGARLPRGERLRRLRPSASSCAAVLVHGEGHVILVRDTHRWLLELGAV